MASIVKRIDLSKDKTSPYVRSVVRKVDRELADQVKMINVPVFKAMEKSITTEAFFLNHTDFVAIMGDNVKLLDRMMMHAICHTLTDDLYDAMCKNKGQIGVWDCHTIYNILAAAITFMANSDTGEKYLTGLQYVSVNNAELAQFPENAYMAFSEYNPNRFVQMCMSIRNVAMEAIGGIMEKGIPNLFAFRTGSNIQLKLYEIKRMYMENDMQALWHTYQEMGVEDLKTTPATENLIRVFTDNFEKPFISMLYSNLMNGGFSENIVNLTMGTVRLHVMYDDPVDKNLYDVAITIRLVTKIGEKNYAVEYTTTIGEEFDSVILTLEQLSKNKQETFGKKLRKFYLDMCTFVLNTYMQVIRDNKADKETAAINDDTSINTKGVDIEESEFDELLKDSGVDTVSVE